MNTQSKLKDLRERHKHSQRELADLLGVSQNLVSAWELGNALPRLPELRALCRLFRVTADYLLDESAGSDYDASLAEAQVREVAKRIGWAGIMDRLLGLPTPQPEPVPQPIVTQVAPKAPPKPEAKPKGKSRRA